MSNPILPIIISLLGFIGFIIASYIYNKKRAKKKLICPIRGASCETVVHSDYSKLFSIPIEIIGMIYFVFISLSYSLISILNLPLSLFSETLLVVSFCAFIFSIYLIAIQAFVIRVWCTWCVFSAIISFSIFVLTYLRFV